MASATAPNGDHEQCLRVRPKHAGLPLRSSSRSKCSEDPQLSHVQRPGRGAALCALNLTPTTPPAASSLEKARGRSARPEDGGQRQARLPACTSGTAPTCLRRGTRSAAAPLTCRHLELPREKRMGEERPESQGANRSEIGHTGQGCRQNGPAVEPRDVTVTTGKSAATWRAGSPPRGPAEVKQGSASRARQPPQPGQARVSEASSFPGPVAQEQGCFLETRGCRGEGGRAPGAQGGNMAGVWRGRGAKRR